MSAVRPTPAHRPAALIFILITVLIDVMGLGLVVPVLPKLVTQLDGSPADAVRVLGLITALYAVMQFIFAPLLGALSDRFGRRPILLLALLGISADYALLYFAPNLTWLFVGRVIAGVMGASVTVANAYIADVTPPEQRARNFGLLGAMFSLGFIVGPALGGVLGGIDLRLPFAFAAGLSLLNVLYGAFVLPESLPRERRAALNWRKLNPFSSLASLGRFPLIRNLTGAFVLIGLAQQAIISIWVLYTERVIGWSTTENGVSLAVYGMMDVLVQAFLVGLAVKFLGEKRTIIAGLCIGLLEYLLLGAARHGWLIYMSLIAGTLGNIAMPTIQGLVSRQVSEQEQGALQGALSGLRSLTGVAGPLLYTAVFAAFTAPDAPAQVPGAPFYLAALFLVAGIAMTVVVLNRAPGLKAPVRSS